MASFNGVTAEKADEILGMSVISGEVNGSGHLILVRENGETIDAGDFTAIMTDIIDDSIATTVAALVPNYVAGTVFNKGNLSGNLSFSGINNVTLVNAMITITLTGNSTINTADFPASPKPNTQFAVKVTQDATGGRTLAIIGAVKKSLGSLVVSAGPGDVDMIVFIFDGTTWYAGLMGVDFS